MFYRLSNFAVINDKVISVSINLSVALIAIWATIIKRFSVGVLPLNYYICTGMDPSKANGIENYQSLSKKYNSSLIVLSVSFLLHLALGPKIFLYKRKAEKRVVPVVLGNFSQQPPNDAERASNFVTVDKTTSVFSPLRYDI